MPRHEDVLRLLQTERECAARDCDHSCGACDLSWDQADLINAYDSAIALIERLTPRPLSLDEARANLGIEPVIWVEICDRKTGERQLHAGVWNGVDYYIMQTEELLEPSDLQDEELTPLYGTKYRFWSSQPTEEERSTTPWTS